MCVWLLMMLDVLMYENGAADQYIGPKEAAMMSDRCWMALSIGRGMGQMREGGKMAGGGSGTVKALSLAG